MSILKRLFGHLDYNAPVVLSFFFISLCALLLNTLTDGATNTALFSVYRSSFFDPLFYLRLFCHVLGHANWTHFLGNMMLFLVVGPPMEEKYGSRALLAGIIVTAGITGILHCLLFPQTALLGASGIDFMLIMLSSVAGLKEGKIPVTMIVVAVLYLGGQVVDIATVQDNVANLMHIVGGICGCVFGYLAGKIRLSGTTAAREKTNP